MTLNLRYGNAQDGPNSWDQNHGSGNRKSIVDDLLQKYRPDIFCTQEALHYQILDIADILKGWEWTGIAREGGNKGEYSAIFYDSSTLSLLEHNTFWLSKEPDKVGSKSWNAKLPRIVTWARFRSDTFAKPLYVFNTHFSNKSTQARINSAKLLTESVNKLADGDSHVFITGDFNSSPESRVWDVLTGGKFVDAWLRAERRSGPAYTFHGFEGKDVKEKNGKRIDWILYRSRNLMKPKMVKTITYSRGKRYPSDHFPVLLCYNEPWSR
jgi:endonuclease/exonuclease/phosphatase family metal-dependent hydrolase